ncbi:hypothetical protein BDZ91DRAFT_386754 [Kalaharituber pfeilii]|nr:hypothetical protein BDZ91DRAFT_386754 [Kalaharituber pfeilii]
MASGRHSYGGPSDGHVLMNPIAPTTTSRNMNGGGKSVTSKSKVNGAAAVGRHSLGSNTPSSLPTPQQQYAIPQNNYHQRQTPPDMVVENLPNSATSNNNTHYNQHHISQLIHQNVPAGPVTTNTRKSKPPYREIISLDSDTEEANKNVNNNMNNPAPSGPSLAGSNSRNRSLLGQHYDPIRPNRASASPSISSLIDPHPPPPPAPPTTFLKPTEKPSAPPAIKPDIDSPPFEVSINVTTPATSAIPVPPIEKVDKPVNQSSKETTSSIPPQSGNGLLSQIDILGSDNTDKIDIPTIYIHVPLNGETNKYVNFAKLAEEKYGPYAFNPRLARERMRLADMSGDEMIVDGSESESNMEDKGMSGIDGESTTEAKPKRKQKRKIQDSYDSQDPFIDDSELLFEEQAAATKDGFFVYSGPLIPQGEKVQIERADGTTKRGRGGGRARGTARGGAAKPSAPRKQRVNKKKLEKEKEERERQTAIQQKGTA